VRGDPRLIAAAAKAAGGHALTLNLLGSYVAGVQRGVIEEAKAAVAELVEHGSLSGHDRAARMMESYVRRFEALADTPGTPTSGTPTPNPSPHHAEGVSSTRRGGESASGPRQAGREAHAIGGGAPELALLHLVGLFDRPAEKDAIDVVKAAGLGAPLAALGSMTPQRWSTAVSRLRAQRLLLPRDPARPHDLDAHPLVRAHFGARLKREAPDVFRATNLALYEHYKMFGLPEAFRTPEAYGILAYKASFPEGPLEDRIQQAISGELTEQNNSALPAIFWHADSDRMRGAAKLIGTSEFEAALAKFQPDDLAGMAPLFCGIAHGAAAGEHRLAYQEVYVPRVKRGNAAYIVHKLGALGPTLGTLAHFFDSPWSTPAAKLADRDQAMMLNNVAFALRAQGRLRDAEEASAAAVTSMKQLGDDNEVALNASNLSEVRLTLGDVKGAVAAAREAVEFADQTNNAFLQTVLRAKYADMLHQSGDVERAATMFAEAERLQVERQNELPRLYSFQGYLYCDLLLGTGGAGEVRDRAEYGLELYRQGGLTDLLSFALDTLSLGRAAHAARHLSEAHRTLDEAVDGLRKAGQEDDLPRGLLARAACLRDMGEWTAAARDLKETREIAERGEMRLFLTDWHLESARLLLAQLPRPTVKQGWFGGSKTVLPKLGAEHHAMRRQAEEHVQAAARLIEQTGYRRRDPEVAALRAQLDAG